MCLLPHAAQSFFITYFQAIPAMPEECFCPRLYIVAALSAQRAAQTTKPFSREVLLTLLQLSTRLQVDSSCGCDEDIVKHM